MRGWHNTRHTIAPSPLPSSREGADSVHDKAKKSANKRRRSELDGLLSTTGPDGGVVRRSLACPSPPKVAARTSSESTQDAKASSASKASTDDETEDGSLAVRV